MTSNFIPHPTMPGEGRCRVCDLPYSKNFEAEVRQHRRFHRDYLRACDTVGAPVPEAVRETWREEGLAIQFLEGATFEERLAGAEMWLDGVFHEYLFGVLLHQSQRRLDKQEFFTKRLEGRDQLTNCQADVAAELRRRYSHRTTC